MTIPVPPADDIQQALGLSKRPEHIKTGGFKAVYQMKNDSGEDEALKAVYIPAANTDEEHLIRDEHIARAEREIEALGKCNCPHLVSLGSVPAKPYSIAGHDYLVYSEEFLPGKSLDTWIGRQPLPAYHDLYALFGMLVGLIRVLSQTGYIHRDIKPANIMDTALPGRRFVSLDLGIAYKMHGTELTRGGHPPGTLPYMAPELLRSDYKNNMDLRCDLYAAGLTVYVLASSTYPFASQPESPRPLDWRIMNINSRPLAASRTDLPDGFCRIIDRCIRKKPALRYAQLELVEDELRKVEP